MIGGKFTPFIIMDDEDTDMDSMITTFNDLVLANTLILAITRHPEDGYGIAQMDNTTTRLTTFL